MSTDTYDGIILGAGHNGLILQAYLGQAGLKTLSIDRALTAGGGLATVEDPRHPGFWHNTHSFFHRAITRMPWYRDLELERLGAHYIEPPLNVALLLEDGRALEWWTDFEKTVESFARFSPRDAQALRRWRDEFVPIAEKILIPETMSPPVPTERRRQLLERSAAGRRLMEVSRLSPLEFVQTEFEHPTIQAALLFFNGLREVDLRQPGFGHHIPHLNQAFMVILGLERLEQFHDIVAHHERGTIPPTVMWGACPTRFDPSQAPPGQHTAFMWEKLPYRLDGDPANWDRVKDQHGQQMLRLWQRYAPNLESAVSDWFTRSALDTERTLPNMREGDLLIGAFTNDQVGDHRPFPGAGHYRTHLPGLYLCGSSSHPGGNVTGLPGYNAAQVLLADLGLDTPWAPQPIEQQLQDARQP